MWLIRGRDIRIVVGSECWFWADGGKRRGNTCSVAERWLNIESYRYLDMESLQRCSSLFRKFFHFCNFKSILCKRIRYRQDSARAARQCSTCCRSR